MVGGYATGSPVYFPPLRSSEPLKFEQRREPTMKLAHSLREPSLRMHAGAIHQTEALCKPLIAQTQDKLLVIDPSKSSEDAESNVGVNVALVVFIVMQSMSA